MWESICSCKSLNALPNTLADTAAQSSLVAQTMLPVLQTNMDFLT